MTYEPLFTTATQNCPYNERVETILLDLNNIECTSWPSSKYYDLGPWLWVFLHRYEQGHTNENLTKCYYLPCLAEQQVMFQQSEAQSCLWEWLSDQWAVSWQ